MDQEARRKGGEARAKSLSPEARSEIARAAARARWDGDEDLPRATHSGVLVIGDAEIPCYVLENGERILSTRGIMKSLGRTWRGRKYAGTEAPVFLEAKNLKPFVPNGIDAVPKARNFRTDRGAVGEGYTAEILPLVCETYLSARDAQDVLTTSQAAVAKQCEVLLRALSRVGIIALVDEATGYQRVRARDELQKILSAYISAELLPWAKMFPDEFYENLHRIHGWKYAPASSQRTAYIGKLTNKLIYEPMPDGVLEELKRKNPVDRTTKRRKRKLFQFLTDDIGHPHLQRQIVAVTTLLRAAPDKDTFKLLFERAFPPRQTDLFRLLDEAPAADELGA